MPESRIRKKAAFTPPTGKAAGRKPNGRMFLPVMLGLLILGLAWIVVFYVSQTSFPIPKIGNWNLVIGFAILLTGFGMTTRWR